MSIEDKKIKMFQGTYQEYLTRKNRVANSMHDDRNQQIIVLKNRLSEVIGRLSLPSKGDDIEALDKEYHKILAELQKFKA